MNTIALLVSGVVALAGTLAGVASASAGGGGCNGESTDSASGTVHMRENCFVSTVVRVPTGETVTWMNQDSVPHMVTGMGWSAPGATIGQGQAASVRFDRSGVFAYYCPLHLGMVGAVVVGDGSPAPGGSGGFVGAAPVLEAGAQAAAGSARAPAARSGGSSPDWAMLVLGGGLGSAAAVAAGIAGFRLGRASRGLLEAP
ncbi:MAG TPA: plastocyanin/azurin family copper-binding protein [Dehalococcoidia bacterium]|nr:plastocyanin/azurin family copper-binding protein [Dehalococcoidia bacterium]